MTMKQPKSFFNYSFFWFLNGSLKTALALASRDGDINNKEKRKMRQSLMRMMLNAQFANPHLRFLVLLDYRRERTQNVIIVES